MVNIPASLRRETVIRQVLLSHLDYLRFLLLSAHHALRALRSGLKGPLWGVLCYKFISWSGLR